MTDHVSLKDLSAELGLDRSALRKYVIKHGFETVNVRTPDSRSQLTLAVTSQDAEAIRQLRQSQGFGGQPKPVENGVGYFYVIRVIPEFSPNRIKVGFAVDMDARLSAHRTSAPSAEIVKAWPCKRAWEQVAITSVTRVGCTLVANEVYDCDSVSRLVKRGDEFFAIMPEPSVIIG